MMRGWFLNRDRNYVVSWKTRAFYWIVSWSFNILTIFAVVIIISHLYDLIPSEQDLVSVDVNLTILGLYVALLGMVIAVSAFLGFFSLEKAVKREVEEQITQKLTDAYKEEFLKKVHEDAKISDEKKSEIIAAKESKNEN